MRRNFFTWHVDVLLQRCRSYFPWSSATNAERYTLDHSLEDILNAIQYEYCMFCWCSTLLYHSLAGGSHYDKEIRTDFETLPAGSYAWIAVFLALLVIHDAQHYSRSKCPWRLANIVLAIVASSQRSIYRGPFEGAHTHFRSFFFRFLGRSRQK